MPNALIFDIDFNYQTNTLYAATHGRGIWRCQIPNTSTKIEYTYKNEIENKPISLNNKLSVAKKSTLKIENKLFLNENSKIVLAKKATLSIAKQNVRNQFNQIINIEPYLIKKKGSKLILK